MCAYRIMRLYNFTSLFSKYRIHFKPNAISQQNTRRSIVQFPIDNISSLKKDILLYSYEKSRVFTFLTYFGIAQLGVWVFYGGFMFTTLRDISSSEIRNEKVLTKSSLWKRINLGDKKLRIVSSALCMGIGVLTAFVCHTLPTRIIKELTLCKGGKIASIITYGPFGKTRQYEVALKNLSCITSRTQASSYIAIKMKPKWFYYLIDCRGTFHQPTLFDYTIGTRTEKRY